MLLPDISKFFPILTRQTNDHPLVYLDSAATSQKPTQVINAIVNYYQNHNANVHRGVHTLSDESTAIWEKSHHTISNFFGASPEELIITRNTTEAINAVAYGWADHNLKKDDVILTTLMEHHSNIVTWQEVCKRTGAKLVFADLTDNGELDMVDFEEKLKKHPVKLIAVVHVSNALGTVNNIDKIVDLAKKYSVKKYSNNNIHESKISKIRILVDGAQSAPHMPINFHQMNVDFFAFSGHKMLGPMGIGGFLVKKELLDYDPLTKELPTTTDSTHLTQKNINKQQDVFHPYLFGGGMISSVKESNTEFNSDIIERFTAGTPDVASAVGLAAACEYLQDLGMENVLEHDMELVNYAMEKLQQNELIEIVGPTESNKDLVISNQQNNSNKNKPNRLGSVTFLYKGVHAHDVAQILNSEGIAVRSGHHCTMPLHVKNNWASTTRASFGVYTTKEDIDALILGLEKVKKVFKL